MAAKNVDARSSVFNTVVGDQFNISLLITVPMVRILIPPPSWMIHSINLFRCHMPQPTDTILQKLRPSQMDAYDRSDCLPGTRQHILDKVTHWVSTPSNSNILWIHGVAGSGKSTIATTVANFYREQECLFSSIVTYLNVAILASSSRTLAYQLGSLFNSPVGLAIATAINDTPNAYVHHLFLSSSRHS